MNDSKIDRRRHYILMLDTETANTQTDEDGRLDMSSVLVYDLGYQVIDKHGNVYKKASFVNSDIFIQERELMQSAYYAHKLPQYSEDIRNGKRTLTTFYNIKNDVHNTIKQYNIDTVCAHNSRFDYNALNTTQRWETKSKYRYFLPYGIEIWDTLKMSRDVIGKMPTYRRFCEENGYLTKNGQLRFTAEILYRFISKDENFIEAHTGLEDTQIETQILAYCFRQHKAMRKKLWD